MILPYLSTELIVCVTAIVMLGLEMGRLHDRRILAFVGCGGSVLAAAAGVWTWHVLHANPEGARVMLFGGSYIIDEASVYFKELMLLITCVALLISVDWVGARIPRSGEYFTLFMFVAFGMLLLASAGDLITIFLGIEMTSMPMYVLSACLKNNRGSTEAGLKFFILGALASAFYLFGASMTVGTLDTIYVQDIAVRISQLSLTPQALYIGLLCMTGAFAFKIAAAPFHMWAPDTYQGAPTTTSAFLSTGPKVAGVAVLMRLFLTGFNAIGPDGVNLKQDWVLIVSVLSLLSMTVGNLVAMHQTNIKRMVAFSGIAHMGYILLGVAAAGGSGDASVRGASAVMFYLYLYALTNLGAWGVVILFGRVTGSEEIADMAGLARRAPWVAFILMLAFLSLAGLPPLSGFIGKFYLFTAAWHADLAWLVMAAILNSVLSLVYYLGVLKVVYWKPASTDESLPVSVPMQIGLVIACFAIVALGFFPPLSHWAFSVAATFVPTR